MMLVFEGFNGNLTIPKIEPNTYLRFSHMPGLCIRGKTQYEAVNVIPLCGQEMGPAI
jgi:hypothetical protein